MGSGLTVQGMTLANEYGEALLINEPPVIISTPAPVFFEGTAGSYNLSPHATDPNEDTLTFVVSGSVAQGISISGNLIIYDGVAEAATTAGHVLTVTDPSGDTANSDTFSIVVHPVTVTAADIPNLQNAWGGAPTSDISNVHDKTHPWYLWSRTAMFSAVEPEGAFTTESNQRANFVSNWTAVHNDNPLNHIVLNMFPTHNIPGFKVEGDNQYGAITSWALSPDNVDRNEVALSLDGGQSSVFYGNSPEGTPSLDNQAGWNINLYTESVRDELAKQSCDILTGSNKSGHFSWVDGEGGDVSSFMYIHHDGSDVIQPHDDNELLHKQYSGTIVSILFLDEQTAQPIEIRISDQISENDGKFPVEDIKVFTGYLDESDGYGGVDPSDYRAFETAHPIWILPAGDKGFIGYHVLGIKYNTGSSGNNTDLFIKQLSSIAHQSQLHAPAAGERYSLNSSTETSTDVDYDRNGILEDKWNAMMDNWATGFDSYWDKLSEKVNEITGHETGRGCNTGNDSSIIKIDQGLPIQHGQYEKFDWIQAEEMNGTYNRHFQFFPSASATHEYTFSPKFRNRKGLSGLQFLSTFIKPQPTSHMTGRLRKAMCDFKVWGDSTKENTKEYYDSLDEVDASYLRFFWALTKLIPNLGFMASMQGAGNYPVAIEECFIDLETDYILPDPIVNYYPDRQSAHGSDSGHPRGKLYLKTKDAGEKIYIRRVGNWVIAVNLRDIKNEDYGGDAYTPYHLNEDIVVEGKDTINAAVLQNLVADGVLYAGESLHHYNPADYYNEAVGTWLKEQEGSNWQEHNKYGPRQSHPADSDNGGSSYKMENVPFIARDNTLNDGSIVDMSTPYVLGPAEAVVWEIKNIGTPPPPPIDLTHPHTAETFPPDGTIHDHAGGLTPHDHTPPESTDTDLDYVASQNTFGIGMIRNISKFFDPDHPAYIYARLCSWAMVQQVGMYDTSNADRIEEWIELYEHNPLIFIANHADSLYAQFASRGEQTSFYSYPYEYAITKDWKDMLIVYDNSETPERLNTTRTTVTGGAGQGQSSVHYRIHSDDFRRWMAKFWNDLLTGGTLAKADIGRVVRREGGGDMSDFMGPFHDGTSMHMLRANVKIHPSVVDPGGTGTVHGDFQPVSGKGTHCRSIVINGRPGEIVAAPQLVNEDGEDIKREDGPLGERDRYRIMFWHTGEGDCKANHNCKERVGFIGYEIDVGGYEELSDNRSRLTFKDINKSHNTQLVIPDAGMKYSISDPTSTSNYGDFDADGDKERWYDAADIWVKAWKEYFDQINDNILETTGHPTGCGWNGLGNGFDRKEEHGWPVTHTFVGGSAEPGHHMTASSDYCYGEHSSHSHCLYKADESVLHKYNINNANIERTMRFYSYANTYLREPSDWMKTKASGVANEITLAVPTGGKEDHNGVSYTNAVDASLARFHYAVMKTVPRMFPGCRNEDRDDLMILEEFFLDFTTGWKDPATLGTYDDNDTTRAEGSDGPLHRFVMATPDWGEKGYVRRYGNTLCIMNCEDFSSAYKSFGESNTYIPSHTSGGWDSPATFTAADQAALYTVTGLKKAPFENESLLDSSKHEKLRRYNFDTYYNPAITDYLTSKASTMSKPWIAGQHYYGPNQKSPFDNDGRFTMKDHPWIIRDSDFNNGEDIDTNDEILLGPHEAIFLEIYEDEDN